MFKKCTGHSLHEGIIIKHKELRCPLCAANLVIENQQRKLRACETENLKPSRANPPKQLYDRHGFDTRFRPLEIDIDPMWGKRRRAKTII